MGGQDLMLLLDYESSWATLEFRIYSTTASCRKHPNHVLAFQVPFWPQVKAGQKVMAKDLKSQDTNEAS